MKKHFISLTGCFLLITTICLITNSCKSSKSKNIPDVSHITNTPEWIEADVSIFKSDSGLSNRITKLAEEHPAFFSLLVEQILQIKTDSGAFSSAAKMAFTDFVQDKRTVWLQDTTRAILGSLDGIKSEFDQAFKYYQYYFPEKELPRLYTLLTEFSYLPFIFVDDDQRDGLGISLEMFLGENFPYRQKLGNLPAFSAYLTRSYNKDHMVMRTLEVLIDDIAGQRKGNRLLDIMVHQGKIKYVLSQLLPTSPDTVIMALDKADINWLQENERDIWAHFLHDELLYESNFREINKLVNPSPNAPGMPPDAPGNSGTWMGWQIVKQYMRRNPEKSLDALLKMDDAQAFLEASKYKPPRE